jgi:hypothetical protein
MSFFDVFAVLFLSLADETDVVWAASRDLCRG